MSKRATDKLYSCNWATRYAVINLTQSRSQVLELIRPQENIMNDYGYDYSNSYSENMVMADHFLKSCGDKVVKAAIGG